MRSQSGLRIQCGLGLLHAPRVSGTMQMKVIVHMKRTYRLASAVAVLAAVIGFAPVQAAVADEATMPALTVGSANLAIYGPAAPLDVTVTVPATADAYIKLTASPNLHFTDVAGNPLPVTHTQDQGDIITIGADDSDHDGVPGAPLPTGTIHLQVSAVYPIGSGFILGQIIDGATGEGISYQSRGRAYVAEGHMYGQYLFDAPTSTPDAGGIPLATGARYPVTQDEDTQMWFGTAPDTTHLRLVFTADQLAAAGYTAPQLAAYLHIQYSADNNVPSPSFTDTHWTLGDDGSARIDFPALDWTSLPAREVHEGLRIKAAWGLPAGKLSGELQVLGPDGRQYAGDTEPLVISDDRRPETLQAAFYGRDAAGRLWQYRGEPVVASHSFYDARRQVGTGWNIYDTMTIVAPLKADGTGELVGRDRSGVLWLYRGSGKFSVPFTPRTRVGGGWGGFTQLTGAGDVTGDGRADLLARDRSGVLWLYRGTGNASAPFAPRTRIGGGWNAYNLTTAGTDVTGDGRADLLARDASGTLWLYPGTGSASAPYLRRVRVGGGWQAYTHIVAVGDLLVDGHPDLLATDARGSLWYYAGTGTAAHPFAPRRAIGTDWTIYNALM